jgi:hypothetical protein
MGLPIPQEMDGQVLHAAFRESTLLDRVALSDNGRASSPTEPGLGGGYTKEAEEEIVERLRKLGYLG